MATPLQFIQNEVTSSAQVQLFLKRDDLNHPLIQGNKYWKLHLNIQEALQTKKTSLTTFGGAFSNHIYATAAAGKASNIKTIGIIRGEQPHTYNFTLRSAESFGMELHFISRSEYRNKKHPEFLTQIHQQFPNTYIIPEGGTNHLAIEGCQILAQEIMSQGTFDYICVPVGTGGTITGLITEIPSNTTLLGFSSLKGNFLTQEVQELIQNYNNTTYNNWIINNEYHFGGYAKHTEKLICFINQFKLEHRIALDPIYTGKMMYGILDMIQQGKFEKNSRILAVHTGGLQGIQGFNERFGGLLR